MERNIHHTSLKKEKWHGIIEHRFKKTADALQKIEKDCSGDHIHDFRVEIKKLKAFTNLIGYNVPDPAACKIPKPLTKLYKALGSLREWQIQKQNIVKAAGELQFEKPLNYLHKISRETDACQRRVRSLIQRVPDSKKMAERIKNNGPDDLSPASITRFIQTKIQKVQELLQNGNKDDESMHDMRKKIKDVQYILSGLAKTGEIDKASAPLESVQQVSTLLGDFHDLCTTQLLLKKELNINRKETDEKKLLRKIKDNWQAEKLKLRRQTLLATRSLIERHFSEGRLN